MESSLLEVLSAISKLNANDQFNVSQLLRAKLDLKLSNKEWIETMKFRLANDISA